jgi:hypothetical protein
MQSKSQASSKPFFHPETKEDFQWKLKNSKPSFRRSSEGDFTAEFFLKLEKEKIFSTGRR